VTMPCPQCGWKPARRLAATPAGKVTVWVTETKGSGELLMRLVNPVRNDEAAQDSRLGWTRLDRAQWESLRDCVDRFFEAVNADVVPAALHGIRPSSADTRKEPS
jgi:hypothetical protein